MLGLYVDYSSSAVEHVQYVQYDRHICSGAYASNVKYMYTSASAHIVASMSLYEAYVLTGISYLQMGNCMLALKVSYDRAILGN